jgi:hypothetical protein
MATKAVNEITINNIRIGGKAPKAIHKGGVEVKEVKKGSTVVYKKENVTYTLTQKNVPSYTSSATSITVSVNSFKGSSTPVALTTSNVSITSGTSASITSVSLSSGYIYNIVVKIPSGYYNNRTTIKVKVTQPVSGQSIELSINPATAYLTLNKLGFRFSGAFPAPGFDLGVSTIILGPNGTHFENYWGQDSLGSYGISQNWISGVMSSYIDSSGNVTGVRNYVYYNNNQQQGEGSNSHTWGPMVKNGDTFSASFYFGATWAGTSAYNNYTWYFHVKDFSGNYIKPASSSKYWEVGTQPCYIGVTTTFQNITADKRVDLIADFNWSWNSSWWNNL